MIWQFADFVILVERVPKLKGRGAGWCFETKNEIHLDGQDFDGLMQWNPEAARLTHGSLTALWSSCSQRHVGNALCRAVGVDGGGHP